MNNITIVIPVYKDWSSLNLCIESLKMFVDIQDTILLVNDIGPEWNDIEKKILNSIRDDKRFIYKKNPENIGFVKTCNRAVLEIDKSENDIMLLNSDTRVTSGFLEEMQKVLYHDELNGVVCPRSNNATFLSVPVNGRKNDFSPEESYTIYQEVKDYLPQMNEIVTGVGFAFLVKRELIQKYGLFDEVFSPGYNEENDFCMRIREYGYKIMVANRAFVFHDESKSFGKTKNELELKNSAKLLKRYPYFWEIVNEYNRNQITAIDYFADLIVDGIYEKKRVLLDLSGIDKKLMHDYFPYFNEFYKKQEIWQEKYDIYICISNNICIRIINKMKKNWKKFKIYKLQVLPKGGYDAAIVFGDMVTINHKVFLRKNVLRSCEFDKKINILEAIDIMINKNIDLLKLIEDFEFYKKCEKELLEKKKGTVTYMIKTLGFIIKKFFYVNLNFLFIWKMRIKRK